MAQKHKNDYETGTEDQKHRNLRESWPQHARIGDYQQRTARIATVAMGWWSTRKLTDRKEEQKRVHRVGAVDYRESRIENQNELLSDHARARRKGQGAGMMDADTQQ